MDNLTLVIMAAGMGSRFGGLKQIEPVGPSGEIIADYSVYDAIKAGFKKVIFIIRKENLKYFQENITKKYQDKIEGSCTILLGFIPSCLRNQSIRIPDLKEEVVCICESIRLPMQCLDHIVSTFKWAIGDGMYCP